VKHEPQRIFKRKTIYINLPASSLSSRSENEILVINKDYLKITSRKRERERERESKISAKASNKFLA